MEIAQGWVFGLEERVSRFVGYTPIIVDALKDMDFLLVWPAEDWLAADYAGFHSLGSPCF